MTEVAYDMETWELREFPHADWLSREDRELLKGTMPSTFSGSIRSNLVLRNSTEIMEFLFLRATRCDFQVLRQGKLHTKRSRRRDNQGTITSRPKHILV